MERERLQVCAMVRRRWWKGRWVRCLGKLKEGKERKEEGHEFEVEREMKERGNKVCVKVGR